MLDLIRKKKKTTLIKLVFWAIIATFVGTIFLVWGKGSDGSGDNPEVAATVNKTQISFQQYQSAYRNLYQLYQGLYRQQFTPELEKQLRLPQQALDQLVEEVLLLQEADRRGLKVSQDELVTAIAQIPAFQDGGSFSKERYLQVLNYQRITPDEFEALQKRQLLADKVREQLQTGLTVSDEEIAAEFRKRNEKVNLAFVRVVPGFFENRVKITEPELTAFFTERREEFRLPDMVALRYLQFEPARFAGDVTFSEEELEKFYRRHLDRFEIAEQVKAAHILIRAEAGADEATRTSKRDLALKVLAEAREGQDFAALARKYSDDPGSAIQGGDLGYFTRGTMVPPFEQAAFALKSGELSDLVETPFGYHIIKCEEVIDAGVKPLAAVIDEVKAGLGQEKAAQLAFEKAMDAYNINRRDGSLEAAAKANGLELKETAFFGRDAAIDGLGDAAEIGATAFALAPGELARPVRRAEGVILFTVKERRDSRLPELTEVRPRVEATFRSAQAVELARQAASRILTALKEGGTLAVLAAREGFTVEETGLFARASGDFVPRLGNAPELAEAAFTLSDQQPVAPQVYDLDGRFVVARQKSRETADMQALDETLRSELQVSLLDQKKNEAIEKQLKELRGQAEITYARALQVELEGK
jgi:peptidyl-prolyl cis-trans isomerase D